MVDIIIENGNLQLTVRGIDKVLSLRSELTISLTHVRGITADPGAVTMPKGLKTGGARIPGVIYAGTFLKDGDKVFWDVHNAAHAVVIELEHETFKRLVVEVKKPSEVVAMIEQRIK